MTRLPIIYSNSNEEWPCRNSSMHCYFYVSLILHAIETDLIFLQNMVTATDSFLIKDQKRLCDENVFYTTRYPFLRQKETVPIILIRGH